MHRYRDLLAGCHREDAQSQRVLYDLYKARLMGLCRRYTSSRDEAKDVLQEAFIKIFRKISQLTDPDKLESWMKSIVVNTAIDHYRKANAMPLEPITETLAVEVAEDVFDKINDEILVGFVNQLPDGCRLVFNMFVIEGYTHAEIAQLLQITSGTSRSQLNYAKALLKSKLNCHNVAQYYEKFA